MNTLFVATFTYGRGIAGRQVPGQPLPDHGKQEYDTDTFKGGSYTKVHPQYYKDTVDPELPRARFRRLRRPRGGPARGPEARHEDHLLVRRRLERERAQHRAGCRRSASTARNADHALLQQSQLSQLAARARSEDYARSYEIDGIMWGSERQGAFSNALGASHGGGGGDAGRTTCFCQFCETQGQGSAASTRPAPEPGFQALDDLRARRTRGTSARSMATT